MVLFKFFTCLTVFSWIPWRDLCVSFFMGFYVFTCILLYFSRKLFMSYLRSSIIFMRWKFKSQSCFSGVLWYSGLAVGGERGYDCAKWHWFLFHMFLHLPVTISLSQVSNGLAVSDWILSFLWALVVMDLLGFKLSLGVGGCLKNPMSPGESWGLKVGIFKVRIVVLASIRNQAEQVMGSKEASSIPPWPLHQLLPPGPCPVQVSVLAFFSDGLQCGHIIPISPFLSNFLLVTVFHHRKSNLN